MACSVLSICPPSPTPNPRQWNAIIKHQVLDDSPHQAILTYIKMLEAGASPDNYTFPILLKAATHLSSPHIGPSLHAHTIKTGFSIHVFVQTALIVMYSALGYVELAQRVFDKMSQKDLVAYNSMLDAYASRGLMGNATELFNSMLVKDRVSRNIMVLGYSNIRRVDSAEEIFSEIPARDVDSWNSMISAYVKAGKIELGRGLFDQMRERNVVSWNAMISGYLQNQQYTQAIDLFHDMKAKKLEPNHVTLVCVLSACAHTGSLEAGRAIHIYAMEIGPVSNTHVATSLIDMYAKCGDIETALEVFYKVQEKDIYCWNSIILSLAIHGFGEESKKLFDDMLSKGMKPDDITFIGLLSACSHAGMVEEGHRLFECMEKEHGLSPKAEHYGCMVDLFGRAGLLDCAYDLVEGMPFEPSPNILGALLSACMVHGDVEMGEKVAKRFSTRGYWLSDGEYMMLANMYAAYGRWEEANRWRGMMNDAGVRKTAGSSMIEVNGRMHRFLAGDLKIQSAVDYV
ncbi:hypothetical protein AAC387_Pa03g0296 [Persea americana]